MPMMPENHWLMVAGENVSPAPFLPNAQRSALREALRFALRGATENGTILDFDPDALEQNLLLACCGAGLPLVVQEDKVRGRK